MDNTTISYEQLRSFLLEGLGLMPAGQLGSLYGTVAAVLQQRGFKEHTHGSAGGYRQLRELDDVMTLSGIPPLRVETPPEN
jgi:hypothetical protein